MICKVEWSYSNELVCDRLSKKEKKLTFFHTIFTHVHTKLESNFRLFFERPDEVLTLVSQ
jgi:hypothetical protein